MSNKAEKPTNVPAASVFQRLANGFALVEDTLIVLILLAMIGLAGSQIVLRNLFDTGLAWGDPLLRVSVLWIGLLGAMAATRDNNHIRIDILSRFMSPRLKLISDVITNLFTAVVCAVIAWYAAQLVIVERQDGINAFANVPAWICELIIPIGFTVMAVRFLTLAILSATGRTEAATEDSIDREHT